MTMQSSPPGSAVGPYISARSKLTAGTFWSALIDDVCIYDRIVRP
jgi:hypothetical protein